jgi:tetratricopeptide (TPR) repeat protein
MWLANLFDQAVQSQQRGDLAEAERLYRQLIKLAPHEDAARILLAEIKQQHEGEEALQILDTVRDKNATFWAKRGKVLGILGREDEAEVAYKRALKMDPRSPHAFFNRGFLRLSSGKYIEALGDYDAGLAIVPTYADGHNNRGWCLLNVGRFE